MNIFRHIHAVAEQAQLEEETKRAAEAASGCWEDRSSAIPLLYLVRQGWKNVKKTQEQSMFLKKRAGFFPTYKMCDILDQNFLCMWLLGNLICFSSKSVRSFEKSRGNRFKKGKLG